MSESKPLKRKWSNNAHKPKKAHPWKKGYAARKFINSKIKGVV